MKNEIRTVECQLSVRENSGDAQGESRTIRGTAIVFNRESQVLDEWGQTFREVILPEACKAEWLATQDIKMNMLHDRGLTVARYNKGEGNLRLTVTREGVDFEFDAPKCDIGDRCLELVREGVYTGCSFEFLPDEYDIEERGKGQPALVRHKKFRMLAALTIGMDPAYVQTSVNARELGTTEEAKEEPARRENPLRRKVAAIAREIEIDNMFN